ncbi:MAG: rhodanese-like domain-containing protein [Rickettsiales bacterium]|nr:rhodanese-like domain-containing protein [Rickettsiales bacterium]
MNNSLFFPEEILARDAFQILKNEKNSYLIDVRTLPEWSFSGLPNLSEINKEVLRISWLFYPKMEFNSEFANHLQEEISDKESKLFFLCKVGGRSFDAAIMAKQLGYKNSYNVTNGFEGEKDEMGRRGFINGWKAEGLPWFQS